VLPFVWTKISFFTFFSLEALDHLLNKYLKLEKSKKTKLNYLVDDWNDMFLNGNSGIKNKFSNMKMIFSTVL